MWFSLTPLLAKIDFCRGWGNKINDVVWNKTLMQVLDLASKIKKIYRPGVNRFDCVNLWYEIECESQTGDNTTKL